MKVIKKTKSSVLLEDENKYRFFVEREVYDSAETTEELYEKSIPHSLSFSLILADIIKENADAVEKVLYAQGIHSVEDLLNNRKQVNDTLRKYFSADNIIKFANNS